MKSIVAFVLAVVFLFLTVCIIVVWNRSEPTQGDDSAAVRSRKNSEPMSGLSLEDIMRLPANPTYDDVAKLPNVCPFADNLMYRCPAKKGGVYFFSFFPTREVALPEKEGASDKLMLVAVIKFPSANAFLALEGGEYVYPERLAGVKFTGFMLEPK